MSKVASFEEERGKRLVLKFQKPIAKEFAAVRGKLTKLSPATVGLGLICRGRAFGRDVQLPVTSTELIAGDCQVAAIVAVVRARLAQLRQLRAQERKDEKARLEQLRKLRAQAKERESSAVHRDNDGRVPKRRQNNRRRVGAHKGRAPTAV